VKRYRARAEKRDSLSSSQEYVLMVLKYVLMESINFQDANIFLDRLAISNENRKEK